MARPEFRMNGPRQPAIELPREKARKQGVEVVALAPVPFFPEAGLHTCVKARAGQRVTDRDADVIGRQLTDELAGLLDLSPSLARIAKLQEEPDADAGGPQPRHGAAHLIQGQP